jgi:hypothetical protein
LSATIRDLLLDAQAALQVLPANGGASAQAAAAIGHCGRALAQLGLDHESGYREMGRAVAQLVEPCAVAQATWRGAGGRAEALAGSAVDVIARMSPALSAPERWAVAVAVARVARSLSERARQFPPYESIPQLVAVAEAAATVQQLAMAYPPTKFGRMVLDRAVPVVRPSVMATPIEAVVDAASALVAAVHTRVARRDLTVNELLACATVAETATRRASAVAAVAGGSDRPEPPWAAAPAAWRAVQLACAPFDDGTKTRPTADSGVFAWALQLDQAVHATFEPARSGGVALRERADLADLATGMRAIANQAPDLAHDLGRSAAWWANGGQVFARERRLASYEDRNTNAAFATNRVIIARGRDLADLAQTLVDAQRLGMSLVHELDRSSGTLGHQTHPSLAAAHAARSSRAGDLAVLRVMAARAELRAGAVAGQAQWSFAPRKPIARQPGPGRG